MRGPRSFKLLARRLVGLPAGVLALAGALAAQGSSLLPADSRLEADAPHVAANDAGTVVAVFAVDDEIWCTISRDGGGSFGAPLRVGAKGTLVHGLMRGPRVACGPDAITVTAICGDAIRGRDLYAWRSADLGATWSGPVRVHSVAGAAREGMAAVAARSDGRVLAVWVDLRKGKAQLWGSGSTDGGAHWSADASLYKSPDGGICECCPPAVSFDPVRGDALVAFRNLVAGNRDIYSLRVGWIEAAADPLKLAPGAARQLGTGHWALDGCPMAGPAVATNLDGRPFGFWRRAATLYRTELVAPAAPADPSAPAADAPSLKSSANEVSLFPGREIQAATGPKGLHVLWTDPAGEVQVSQFVPPTAGAAGQAAAETAPRSLGKGFNAALAGAPDGLGPVLAVWEAGKSGPGHLRFKVLSPRRAVDESK